MFFHGFNILGIEFKHHYKRRPIMLVLGRRPGEKVKIGDEITVCVISQSKNQVRLGIEAPDRIPVHREEIYRRIKESQATMPLAANEAINEAIVGDE
jgi:carbon storage regulator